MLDGKQTLSVERQNEEWGKDVPTLESAFPCGTEFSISKALRDVVSFVDSKGTEHVLGQRKDSTEVAVQSFFTTDMSSEKTTADGKKVYDHILLFSALSKSFKFGVENVEKTAETRAAIIKANEAAVVAGTVDAATMADKVQAASKLVIYDTKFQRNCFTQIFWNVMVDWNAELYPTLPGYKEATGRTYAAQRDRLKAFINTNKLISLREVEEGVFYDAWPEDDQSKGFTLLDFDNVPQLGRKLTCFARKCDWEAYKADKEKFFADFKLKK